MGKERSNGLTKATFLNRFWSAGARRGYGPLSTEMGARQQRFVEDKALNNLVISSNAIISCCSGFSQ